MVLYFRVNRYHFLSNFQDLLVEFAILALHYLDFVFKHWKNALLLVTVLYFVHFERFKKVVRVNDIVHNAVSLNIFLLIICTIFWILLNQRVRIILVWNVFLKLFYILFILSQP